MTEHDPTDLHLDEMDRSTRAWLRVRSYVEARLADCREALERDQSHDMSTKLRGRIEELKDLLAAGNPPATSE